MAFNRNVGLAGMKYRGGGPMLAWLLHRISGFGIVLFVGLHIVASFSMQQLGSDLRNTLNTDLRIRWISRSLFTSVYSSMPLTGLRIIILDFWPKLLEYQREITWLQWLIFIPVYGLTVFIMVAIGAWRRLTSRGETDTMQRSISPNPALVLII